jgi:hypothetical protein
MNDESKKKIKVLVLGTAHDMHSKIIEAISSIKDEPEIIFRDNIKEAELLELKPDYAFFDRFNGEISESLKKHMGGEKEDLVTPRDFDSTPSEMTLTCDNARIQDDNDILEDSTAYLRNFNNKKKKNHNFKKKGRR